MQYRRLGRTGLDVSVIGVGTWQLGGEWGKEFTQPEADTILGAARDAGINLVDTAECYGDHLSEQLVGKAIAGDRDHWVVATKFGHRFTGHLERDQLWTVSDVLAQLDRSLTALGTDRIDLYQFHSGGDDVFDNDELWAELARQKTAGKIRALGLSVGSNQNLHQVAQCTDRGIDALQVVYSRLDPEPEAEVLPSAGQQDLGVLAREALAGGLLSGKYAPGTRFTNPTDARSTRGTDAIEERLQQVARIRTEEVPEGADMAAWALAWTLRHPAMTTAIAGCKSREQVESAVRAIEYVEAGHPQQT